MRKNSNPDDEAAEQVKHNHLAEGKELKAGSPFCINRGGGRIESIYQPDIDGLKEINAEYNAPLVRG